MTVPRGKKVLGVQTFREADRNNEMVLVSIVTAPTCAMTRPFTVASVTRVTDWLAISVPANEEPVPIVALDPTAQKMLEAWAPLARIISPAIVRAVPTLKMKTA